MRVQHRGDAAGGRPLWRRPATRGWAPAKIDNAAGQGARAGAQVVPAAGRGPLPLGGRSGPTPERMNRSCYSRILRQTSLAPDIIGRILDGRPPFGLPQLLRDFPSSEGGSGRSLPGAITSDAGGCPHSRCRVRGWLASPEKRVGAAPSACSTTLCRSSRLDPGRCRRSPLTRDDSPTGATWSISSGLPERFGRRTTRAVMIAGEMTTDYSHAELPRAP